MMAFITLFLCGLQQAAADQVERKHVRASRTSRQRAGSSGAALDGVRSAEAVVVRSARSPF